ncbi:uncharacterized protein LOC121505018 [Cheilinus undulatus]|uniref:uncharacterized protein LOC121505018 n=1 Tax=Cheilinus undulatus TaxID=241271 RepID=UPI001BD2A2B2|nr:uncharacterized protein LOC121505018 [Cheilinus undulatus]
MQPQTLRGETRHSGHQQGSTVRKHVGSQRPHTQTLMTTEYEERFSLPNSYKKLVTTTKQTNPNHPLKGTAADVSTFRSFYLAKKWIPTKPKLPQATVTTTTKDQQITVNAANNSTWSSEVQDYTSTYRNDYRVWKISKRQPFRLTDNLTVRTPAASLKSEEARDAKKFNDAGQFSKKCKSWSTDKNSSQGKVKETSLSEEGRFLSTTMADYIVHQCQCRKPIRPSKTQNFVKSQEPMQKTTTTREDFKSWKIQRRAPIPPKHELTVKSATLPDGYATNQKPSDLQPQLRESASTSVTQRPADEEFMSSFEEISHKNGETRRSWTTSLKRGVTWADDGCEEPSETYRMLHGFKPNLAFL